MMAFILGWLLSITKFDYPISLATFIRKKLLKVSTTFSDHWLFHYLHIK
jgi:hypothetical protein